MASQWFDDNEVLDSCLAISPTSETAGPGIELEAISRLGMRGRHGLLWLMVVLLCLMAVCLGHIMEPFVAPPQEVEPGEAGDSVMAEPSRLPPEGAVVTPSAVPTAAPVSTSEPEPARREGRVVLTVVYDNNPYDPRLRPAWGFACLVETAHGVVLFDTGGEGGILLGNLEILGLDPRRIDAVVLSHIHSDHIGGLDALLAVNDDLIVYLPQSFPEGFTAGLAERTRVVEVAERQEILPGVYSTGELGDEIIEQSLVVETAQGLVVLTGCAHPGVARIVQRATEQGRVYLVMGGFHLDAAGHAEVQQVLDEFRALGVEKVAPCHCTGTHAIASFAEAYGPDFIQAGVGTVVSIEP